jgi:hypothetical protein
MALLFQTQENSCPEPRRVVPVELAFIGGDVRICTAYRTATIRKVSPKFGARNSDGCAKCNDPTTLCRCGFALRKAIGQELAAGDVRLRVRIKITAPTLLVCTVVEDCRVG